MAFAVEDLYTAPTAEYVQHDKKKVLINLTQFRIY